MRKVRLVEFLKRFIEESGDDFHEAFRLESIGTGRSYKLKCIFKDRFEEGLEVFNERGDVTTLRSDLIVSMIESDLPKIHNKPIRSRRLLTRIYFKVDR